MMKFLLSGAVLLCVAQAPLPLPLDALLISQLTEAEQQKYLDEHPTLTPLEREQLKEAVEKIFVPKN